MFVSATVVVVTFALQSGDMDGPYLQVRLLEVSSVSSHQVQTQMEITSSMLICKKSFVF